jgi:hypothetical protein
MTGGCQMRPRTYQPVVNILLAGVLTAFAATSPIAAVSPSGTIAGTVTLTAADGETFPGEGARVSLACAADGTTRTVVSDQRGAFRFVNVPVDRCSIQAEVQGFVAPPVTVLTVADQVVGSDLHLGIAPLRVGVNVGGTVPADELKSPRRSCRSDAGRRLDRPAKVCTR